MLSGSYSNNASLHKIICSSCVKFLYWGTKPFWSYIWFSLTHKVPWVCFNPHGIKEDKASNSKGFHPPMSYLARSYLAKINNLFAKRQRDERKKIRNPSIFNIIRWCAGLLGQTTHRPSLWCSKYYFFSRFLAEFFAKIISIYLFIFLKKLKSKEFWVPQVY